MKGEGAGQLENDPEVLCNWTQSSLLEFNLSKCHQLTLREGSKGPTTRYTIDGQKLLTSVECEKNLRVSVYSRLSFNELLAKEVKKANSVVTITEESFLNITQVFLRTLHKALVRQHLEYANHTWKPHLKKYKVLIENIQR